MISLLARLAADQRAWGWLIVALLAIPPIFGYAGYRIAPEVREDWVPQATIDELRRSEADFSFHAPFVAVLESDDFFREDRMKAVWQTITALRDVSQIKQVAWAGNVPSVNLRGRISPLIEGVPLKPEDEFTATDESLKAGREAWLNHPLIAGKIVSEDGKTLLLLINADQEAYEGDARTAEREKIDTELQEALAAHLPAAGIRARLTGIEPLYVVHDRALKEDIVHIQFIAYAVTGILCVLIFRRPAAIIIAGTGPVVGVCWTVGWLMLTGQSHNQLAGIILPVMVMMIGFTDGVHMVVRIRQLRASGKTLRDSIYEAVMAVGPACFLTSLTTAIGFGSLMLSDSEMVAGFGRVSAIGVVLTFVSVVLVTPLLANSFLGRNMHVEQHRDVLGGFLEKMSVIVRPISRVAGLVVLVGIAGTCFSVYMSSMLQPDDRLSDRVPQNSDARQALTHCEEVMGGVRYVRLSIDWKTEEDLTDPDDVTVDKRELWNCIEDCENLLIGTDPVNNAFSIRTLLTVFRIRNAEKHFTLASKLPEPMRRQFYRKDIGRTQVLGRIKDLGIAKWEPVLAELEKDAQKIADRYPGIKISLLSDVMIEGRAVRGMIDELISSLLVAALIIFVVLAVAFRSLRLGLVSILPNVMPLAAAGALRWTISDSLDIASACSFAICLGIAVDDTIHYLTHFEHARKAGKSPLQANKETFTTVGSALVMTTVVMTAGLGTVLTSQMPVNVNFAAMACTTLAVALIADLIFLPALMTLFPGKDVRASKQAVDSK